MSGPIDRLRHDLRTALNHVLGYGEMLLEDAEVSGPPERREALTDLLAQGFELLRLVDAALGNGALDVVATVAGLRVAVQPPAARLLATIAELEHLSPERDAADLHRMTTAVELLCRFAADQAGPALDEAIPGPRGEAASLPPEGAPGWILVADDDAANRDLLGRRLERDGHRVSFAADGGEALALLEAGEHDVVLLDLVMPVLGGYEVLQRMKASVQLRELPVLMISADDGHASVGACIAIGADDYLSKPFDPGLLRARVRACLARRRARRLELEYLRQVQLLTEFAASLESGTPDRTLLADMPGRPDALGGLARVLERAAAEIRLREQRLVLEVQQLRIEIDEARKARAVAEIVETDYFHDLERRAARLRGALP